MTRLARARDVTRRAQYRWILLWTVVAVVALLLEVLR